MGNNLRLFTVILAIVSMPAATASAAYDMSGRWLMHAPTIPGNTTWQLDVQQLPGEIYLTQWNAQGSWTVAGTIDDLTGEFRLVVQLPLTPPLCGTPHFTGTVAADGKTFAANYSVRALEFVPDGGIHGGHYECSPTYHDFPMLGTRCGNQQIDDGEVCDDGNIADGDCCTTSCAIGADGAPCSELLGCGTGTCSSGSCVLSSFASDGAACSAGVDLCIADVCNGSGTCDGNDLAPVGTTCQADTDACTDDVCDASGNCVHPFNTADCVDDGDPCTNDVCDGAGNCTHPFNTAPCTDDGDPCTTDVCDGAGTCTHPFNTAPCTTDGNACTNDICDGAGTCQHLPIAAGESCDLDANPCSPDTCNGAGQCIAAGTDCGVCGTCGPGGCFARDSSGCDSVIPISMTLASDPDGGERAKLKIKVKQGMTSSDLGDPTAATDYTLCLNGYDDLGYLRTIASMSVPAGASWTARTSGFSYKDPTLSADGILGIRLDPSKGFKINGKGPGLSTSQHDFSEIDALAPMLIASDGAGIRCWTQTVDASIYTTTKFKGQYPE